jgi:superfamily II DNA or RNA helicase
VEARLKEKADAFFSYDLVECRKKERISKRNEVRHQEEAINAVNGWFDKKKFPAGTIMAMPTGSGKTFTAARFLTKYLLSQDDESQNYKILWLAHTHHLLEQAFFTFGPGKMDINEKYEVGNISGSKKTLDIRVVSGSSKHQDVADIKSSDDMIIATLQTISGAYNNEKQKKPLEAFLKASNGKLFVIFDEAHHAPAPTYRKFLIGDEAEEVPESLRERFPNMYLLGLTATPTFTDVKRRGWLKDIFPQKIINSDTSKFHSSINNLMFERILAKPKIKEIKTKIDPKVDDQEYQSLVNRHREDIPERIIKRLADNDERNQIIVNSYDKKRCGKTIIFTDYVDQCLQINSFFQDRNKKLSNEDKILADVMYTARSDEENSNILQKFKNNQLDVIINIRMLTEGTDVPDVDTVFLTRQTTSEILLTQMVGRALRGPLFGGTEEANLVFFIDNWKKLINWATWDPEDWKAKEDVDDYKSGPYDLISVSLIKKLIKIMKNPGEYKGEFLKYMPLGWYIVNYYEFPDESEKNDEKENGNNIEPEPRKVRDFVLVFENDKENYSNLIKSLITQDISVFNNDKIKSDHFKPEVKKFRDEFFADHKKHIGKGLSKNIFNILRHMAQNKKNPPKFIEFIERENYDIDVLARNYKKYDRDTEDEKLRTIYKDNDNLWSTLYYDYDHFKVQYNACVEWIISEKYPDTDDTVKIIPAEKKITNKLKNGTLEEKIRACEKLGKLGSQEHLHKKTIEMLHELSISGNNSIQQAALKAFNKIKRELTPKERGKILKRDLKKCLCCGETKNLQIDHINPRSLGGSNSPENLQTLCGKCNGGVKQKEIIDFRISKTPLNKPPSDFFGLGKRHITKVQAEDSEFWKKVLQRNINIFYKCKAVKDVQLNFNNCEWKIELFKGNNPKWAENSIDNLIQNIKEQLAEYNIKCPKNININLKESNNLIPKEYEKLWKSYVKHPKRLTDEDMDKLANYIDYYGLIN